ncbi:MAG: response regulator, partial [Cytophagaceae bacterium]
MDQVNTDFIAGKRILVADDNEMNRLVASTVLSNYGAIIEEAHNGLDALEKLQDQPFDVVLMDVQMPVMDGIEATRTIRSSISDQIPVIALTAFAVKGDSEKFIAAGMSDYLSKPFDEEQLLAVVAKWLAKRQAPPAPEKTAVAPLYDLTALRRMASGDETFITKMTSLFIDYGPASVREIKEAFALGDYETIKKIAHRIKPSVDNLGIISLRDDIRTIEKQAGNSLTSAQLNQLIAKLDTVITIVVTDLQASV